MPEQKKEFTAAKLSDANLEADRWWGAQKGARLIHRNAISVGFGMGNEREAQWVVTIHYEPPEG